MFLLLLASIFVSLAIASSTLVFGYDSPDAPRSKLLRLHALMSHRLASGRKNDNELSLLRAMMLKNTYHDKPNHDNSREQKQDKQGSGACPRLPSVPRGAKLPPFPAALIANVTALLQRTIRKCEPGLHFEGSTATAVSAALVFGDNVHYVSLGCADEEKPHSSPVIPDKTIFRLASNSKTFVAALVLEAKEKNLIQDLDDEVRKIVPEFRVPSFSSGKNGQQPTWRQMISQQAGLPRDSPCNPTNCSMSLDTAIERMKQQQFLIKKTFSRPSYSNVAFSLAGRMVATRVFNASSFESLLDSRRREHWALSNSTGTALTASIRAAIAVPYTLAGIPVPLFGLHFDNPAGGIFSTAADMAKWMQRWAKKFNDGPALYREDFASLHVDAKFRSMWSSPWEQVRSDPKFGRTISTKGGYIPGSSSITAIVPEIGLSFVALWNGERVSASGTAGVARAAMDMQLGWATPVLEALEDEMWPTVPPSFLQQGWLGKYAPPEFLDAITVTVVFDRARNRLLLDAPGFVENAALKPRGVNSSNGARYSFQLHVPEQHYNECAAQGFAAWDGEWAFFGETSSGKRTLEVPGYVFVVFEKL